MFSNSGNYWWGTEFDGGLLNINENVSIRNVSTVLSINCRAGIVHIRDPGITGVGSGLRCWLNPTAQVLILFSNESTRVYRVIVEPSLLDETESHRGSKELAAIHVEPADLPLATVVACFERDEHIEGIAARPAPDGSLIIRYPKGLIRLDWQGLLRWQRPVKDVTAILVQVDRDGAWLESQWWESAGKRTGFRISDGDEIPITR